MKLAGGGFLHRMRVRPRVEVKIGMPCNWERFATPDGVMILDLNGRGIRAAGLLLIAIAVLLLMGGATAAQIVMDGNRIMFGDRVVRLWGIDAPDEDQVCGDGWPAGQNSRKFLGQSTQDGRVECEERGRNQAGEVLSLCKIDGVDLNAAMVRAGMAWADLGVAHKYVVEEAKAAAGRQGVHGHRCTAAWTWRARRRVEPQFNRQ